MRMFGCVFVFTGMIALAAPAAAQAPIVPVLDHIHLNVPDQAKAVEWYQKNFGGAPMTEAPDRLMIGDTRLIFLKAQTVTFTTEPRPLKLASGTMVNFAYLAGPAGAKVELVQR